MAEASHKIRMVKERKTIDDVIWIARFGRREWESTQVQFSVVMWVVFLHRQEFLH